MLDDGRKIDTTLFRQILEEELGRITSSTSPANVPYFEKAAKLFDDISTSDSFVEFLTLPAYDMID